jgi:hypothetical protein
LPLPRPKRRGDGYRKESAIPFARLAQINSKTLFANWDLLT